jgi:outer membrane protein
MKDKGGRMGRSKGFGGLILAGALGWQISAATVFAQTLSLQEAIDLALKQNTGVRAAAEQVAAAESDIRTAKGNYFPTLSVSQGYSKLDGDALFIRQIGGAALGAIGRGDAINNIPEKIDIGENNTTLNTSVLLTQVLYAGGGYKALERAKEIQYHMAEQDLRKQQAGLVFDVTKAYYDVLVAQRAVDVAEGAIRRSEQSVGDVRKRRKEQEALKVEVIGVESRLAADRQTLLTAHNELDIAKMSLNRLLERDFSTDIQVAGSLESIAEPPPLEIALREAMEQNPEVVKARLQVDLAEQSVARAKSYFLPKVQIQGSFQYLDNEIAFQGINYGGTLGITVPFVQDVIIGQGSLGQAQGQKQAAENALRQVMTAVELQVRQAEIQVDQSRKLIGVSEGQVGYYEERFRVSQSSYREQLTTSSDLIDDQAKLTDQELNELRARYGYGIAIAQLRRAIGKI